MSNTILKKEIHEAIDNISDQKALKAFHNMLTKQAAIDKNSREYILTEDQWAEVENRHHEYVTGRVKYISFDDFIKNIDDFKKSLIKKRGNISARARGA